MHRIAQACTDLHRVAQTCTDFHRVAQSCTHCTNVSPAPCTACPLAPRIPYGDNHNHCSCIGNALLNAHMPKKSYNKQSPNPKIPLTPQHTREHLFSIYATTQRAQITSALGNRKRNKRKPRGLQTSAPPRNGEGTKMNRN